MEADGQAARQCQGKAVRDEAAHLLIGVVEGDRSEDESEPPAFRAGCADAVAQIEDRLAQVGGRRRERLTQLL